MKIPIFMLFQFIGIISAWATKALEDGKITAAEGLELVVALASVLGVRAEFDVSDYITPPSPEDDVTALGQAVETPDTPAVDNERPANK